MKFFLLSAIALFAATATAQTSNTVADINVRARMLQENFVEVGDAELNRECHNENANYISSLKAGQYATSAFHNCFRTSDQIYEFTDALAAQNPTLLSKFAISKTYNGATIYGYKLTKGHSQSLYFQALQHAREWIAGSSILFSLAFFSSHGLSYGLFQDYAFREFKKPVLQFEIIGHDFVVDMTTIKTRGLEVYKGINQFAKEVTVFNGGDATPSNPSCGD
ncbi:hypothetical protein H257_19379 [Aphanomyces astaci]|uniref:Peptidase M14 domain-containing protein n=1 Tax=Aphanomyces astaci TaxID=112090 RepID=W4FAF5_APHAT|nr:hypothetical protein H257_19379 [Aphanomyces astaci]ETV63688.1 hypothetical protein H257_19379 [Aphanomyces astaci]|eukprot:XP_009846827.1 hypothetical protein H257_19379 [Aphanomyces astaci]